MLPNMAAPAALFGLSRKVRREGSRRRRRRVNSAARTAGQSPMIASPDRAGWVQGAEPLSETLHFTMLLG
jgi:hypothetical protein